MPLNEDNGLKSLPSPMPFTDDELKRLKECIDMTPADPGMFVKNIEALIARLEAAERCARACNCLSSARDAWRKAAGK
jgi:hypothetical protein